MKGWQVLIITVLGLSIVMFFRENDMIGKGIAAIMVALLLIYYYIQSKNEKNK